MAWEIVDRQPGYCVWRHRAADGKTRYATTANRRNVAVEPTTALGFVTKADAIAHRERPDLN